MDQVRTLGETLSIVFIFCFFRSSETQWRILNDSSVTEGVGWDQFVTRTSQHGRDTPYLLLYHRLGQEDTEERLPAADKLARVIADNRRFVRDMDSFVLPSGGDPDDQEDKGGAGCRDNFGQMGGGRFVC